MASCSNSTDVKTDVDWVLIDLDDKPVPNSTALSLRSGFALTCDTQRKEREAIVSERANKWIATAKENAIADNENAMMQHHVKFILTSESFFHRISTENDILYYKVNANPSLLTARLCNKIEMMFFYMLPKDTQDAIVQDVISIIRNRAFQHVEYIRIKGRSTSTYLTKFRGFKRLGCTLKHTNMTNLEKMILIFQNNFLFTYVCQRRLENFSDRFEYFQASLKFAMIKSPRIPQCIMEVIFTGSPFTDDRSQRAIQRVVIINQAVLSARLAHECGVRAICYKVSKNKMLKSGLVLRAYLFYLDQLDPSLSAKIRIACLNRSPELLSALKKITHDRDDDSLRAATHGHYKALTELVSMDSLFCDSKKFRELLQEVNLEEHFCEWSSRATEARGMLSQIALKDEREQLDSP